MKAAKSLRSQLSCKSTKSFKTTLDSASKKGDDGGFTDFPAVLTTACMKFQCPYTVLVEKVQQCDEFYKSMKYGDTTPRYQRKLSRLPTPATARSQPSNVKTSDDSVPGEPEISVDANTITIKAVYDAQNCLTEILMNETKVPRILIQIIALLVPYFENLTTLTVRRCQLDYYTIHEVSKILENSTVTSVCLDDSPAIEHTYEVFLNEKSNLRSLSLCKCKLDDDDCKQLAAKLHHGAPAEHLQVLNLSSNHITDVGAKFISDALRTNRRLRYLSLADNRINDEGAGYLFGILTEFTLTHDEIKNLRLRYMKYLKCKEALYAKYLNEYDRSFDQLSQVSRKSVKKRKSARKGTDSIGKDSNEGAQVRAELLANEMIGKFCDPFDLNSTKHHDNCHYCLGNMVLCYLNLAYNNLSFLSIKKLLNVVMYQNITKKINQCGLIKVIIEGNNLPMCKEILLLNELFGRNTKCLTAKYVKRRSAVNRAF